MLNENDISQNYLNSLFSLKGKNVLVTGGSSGIGKAIAEQYNDAGASVIYGASSRGIQRVKDIVEKAQEKGNSANYVIFDASDLSSIPEMIKTAESFFGPIDILVNAAGVNLREKWEDITIESWEKTININLSTPFFVSKAIVAGMLERGYGRIINIASLQAARAFPNSIPYGATKGGVAQLTRAMAEAWSKNNSGVTVNAIAPGFFKTSLTSELFDQDNVIKKLERQTIIGRNGNMEDFAGISILLASPSSSFITGQVYYLDGGWSAK